MWVALSSDGIKLIGREYGGGIYTSQDSGVSWTFHSLLPRRYYRGVASSADGSKILASAEKAGKRTITYAGTTNSKDGATVTGKGNFSGWKFKLEMVAK